MRTLRFLMPLFLILSCSPTDCEISLSIAEEIMTANPDSALAIIRSIDKAELSTKRLQAKHSLLHSMALDKCYIDLKTDSIIAPAMAYYHKRGSDGDRLKAYYYRGIVSKNSDSWEDAMLYYVKAEQFERKCKDRAAVARLHNAKMYIYRQLYQYEQAILEGRKAAEVYYSISDTNRFINTMLDVGVAYKGLYDNNSLGEVIEEIIPYENSFTPRQYDRYQLLQLYLATNDSIMFKGHLGNYVNSLKDVEIVNWVSAADAYLKCQNLDSASWAIRRAWESYREEYTPMIYRVNAEIEYRLRDFKNSAYHYKRYVEATDVTDVSVFKSDAEYVEDKYYTENQILRKRQTIIILIFSSVIILILGSFSVYAIYKHYCIMREDKLRFEQMYNSVLNEQQALRRTRKELYLDKNVRKIIDERLSVLNKFVLANISGSFTKEASLELKSLLEDREYFLESTRMSFAISHHRFLKFLSAKGLSDWEIGCCCLYCIGLNGSEIGEYLHRKAYYKVSGKIREKLGLDRSVNLDTYLLLKIKEIDS